MNFSQFFIDCYIFKRNLKFCCFKNNTISYNTNINKYMESLHFCWGIHSLFFLKSSFKATVCTLSALEKRLYHLKRILQLNRPSRQPINTNCKKQRTPCGSPELKLAFKKYLLFKDQFPMFPKYILCCLKALPIFHVVVIWY